MVTDESDQITVVASPPKLGHLPKDSPPPWQHEKQRTSPTASTETTSTASETSEAPSSQRSSKRGTPVLQRKQKGSKGGTPVNQRADGGGDGSGGGSHSSSKGGTPVNQRADSRGTPSHKRSTQGTPAQQRTSHASSQSPKDAAAASTSSAVTASRASATAVASKPQRPWWGSNPELEAKVPMLLQGGAAQEARRLLQGHADEDAPITQFYLGGRSVQDRTLPLPTDSMIAVHAHAQC